MPLQKLQFRPGVNREGTTLSNEGGWYDCDKVRFRSGYPEKIGGWQRDGGVAATTEPVTTLVATSGLTTAAVPPSGAFWGVAKAMWNWINLTGYNLLAVGTNLKYYIQNSSGGAYNDVTPIRLTNTAVANAFTTTNTSSTVTVNDAGHGAQAGDFVNITSVSGTVNGITAAQLTGEFQVQTVTSNNTYTIIAGGTATSTGTSAVTATFNYQLTTGNTTFTYGTGWGVGGWSGVTTGYPDTGWGSPAPAGLGIGVQLRLWSQSNYGEDLVFNPRGAAMYYWANNANPNIYDRGQIIKAGTAVATKSGSFTPDATCPSIANFVLVSDASRFTFAFGCNDPTGVYATTAQDPMQVRWSDQNTLVTWLPLVTNQAGGIRLSHGSAIITAIQTRQEILVLTDSAIYSFQYLGAPYVWNSQILGDNISIASPNAVSTVNNVTYWMGTDKFYMYSGRVETLPCSLWQYVFNDINKDQGYQVFCGTNEGYSEIWWFYCSGTSTTVDKYVIYNYLDRVWYYGSMARTAWLDSGIRQYPMAANYENRILYHESAVDDVSGLTPVPINAYVQSSDFDIGDGHNFGFVWRILPDINFNGSNVNQPYVTMTVKPRRNSGAPYGAADNPQVTSANNYGTAAVYNIQEFSGQVYTRLRGRQLAFRIESNSLGVSWQLGTPRIDIRNDGRR